MGLEVSKRKPGSKHLSSANRGAYISSETSEIQFRSPEPNAHNKDSPPAVIRTENHARTALFESIIWGTIDNDVTRNGVGMQDNCYMNVILSDTETSRGMRNGGGCRGESEKVGKWESRRSALLDSLSPGLMFLLAVLRRFTFYVLPSAFSYFPAAQASAFRNIVL